MDDEVFGMKKLREQNSLVTPTQAHAKYVGSE
jgi:hypothetical protein